MRIKIVVPFEDALVCYEVLPDKQGIYNAYLVSLNGNTQTEPPRVLTMVRSFRRWVGSSDPSVLAEQIGRALDQRLSQEPSRLSSPSDPASRTM